MQKVIRLKNMKAIPMMLPNGEGGMVNLNPGEEKVVQGEWEHYRRMPEQGFNGLVVKEEVGGKIRLVEASKGMDVHMMKVTNHREIPMRLATGIGQAAIAIGPKETSKPFKGRVSTVKQMNGIHVEILDATPEAPAPKTDDPDPEIAAKAAAEAAELEKAKAAAAKAEAEEAEKKAKAEAENDPLVIKRRELTLPATREEWFVHKEQMTWPDTRAIAKALDIKTKSLTKEQLIAAIEETLYPES